MKLTSLVLLSALTTFTACREDGPHLYFIDDPFATRASGGEIIVTGELWSVIPWTADHEFCVTAIWHEAQSTAMGGLNLDQQCSLDAVPRSESASEGFKFTLQSRGNPAPGTPIEVAITSDYFELRGEANIVMIETP